jgi:hypothetical protein
MAAESDVTKMREARFWAQVCDLTTGQGVPPAPYPVTSSVTSQFSEDLRTEGWAQCGPLVPPDVVRRLQAGVEAVRAHRLPAPFLWMYAEPWQVVAALDPLFRVAMGSGYRVLPCFWTWFVPRGANKAGWPVHRDRTRGPPNVLPDGTPLTLSVWIALSEATPHNGCMYVVPAPLAPKASKDIQVGDVRALPARPGEVLAWRQDVWHWGGRSSTRAAEPRISMGIELQRATDHAFDEPLLTPGTIPPLEDRLAFVGGNLWRYRRRMQNPAIPSLARALVMTRPHLRQTLSDLPVNLPVEAS